MPKARYQIDGEGWVPLSKAAKLLGTNTVHLWKLIEESKLRARPSRVGSSITVVALKELADLRVEREQWRSEAKKRQKPKKASTGGTGFGSPAPSQRIPGHREQYALPMHDSGRTPPWRRDR